MEAAPKDWPRISSALFYEDAATAIDWLCRTFGFEVRLKVEGEGGRIEHSELVFGEGLIMVGTAGRADRSDSAFCASPRALGGANTQSLCVYVDDVDAHCDRARAAGATIVRAAQTDDYGEEYGAHRSYQAEDLEGHRWWFMQRLREPKTHAN
ncbi:MAG TPA: VOC family protein [Dehalococcoidia bacterium]|nr:VOC family protein [Dehalococcoidia bacterium]